MALTGELSDLSLAELIEFFCNQRKTGRLEVTYPAGSGYFYLKSGAVVHARIGDLRGIDAVYFALTQHNASFNFTPAVEAPEHSINQPWMSVVLEGLRRMDEGVTPRQPSANSLAEPKDEVRKPIVAPVAKAAPIAPARKASGAASNPRGDVQAFGVLLSSSESETFARRRWNPALVVTAVVAMIAIVGVPWGWYRHKNGRISANDASAATPSVPVTQAADPPATVPAETVEAQAEPSPTPDANDLARRQYEARMRERAKLERQSSADAANQPTNGTSNAPTSSAAHKRATVTVTYDENGRVIAASGGDATALRIARQKRFPPGKPGSATITIPIN